MFLLHFLFAISELLLFYSVKRSAFDGKEDERSFLSPFFRVLVRLLRKLRTARYASVGRRRCAGMATAVHNVTYEKGN